MPRGVYERRPNLADPRAHRRGVLRSGIVQAIKDLHDRRWSGRQIGLLFGLHPWEVRRVLTGDWVPGEDGRRKNGNPPGVNHRTGTKNEKRTEERT